MMKVKLIPIPKSPHEKTVSIRQTPFVIGRAEGCDLKLDNPRVSRRHCEITVVDGEVRVRDLGSSNGTFVNGEPALDGQTLSDGDTLCLATNPFKVAIHVSRSGINLLFGLGRGMVQAPS